MTIVTLQLGQCGNQVGGSLFDLLAQELQSPGYDEKDWEDFFDFVPSGRREWRARAVLVDMEPKAIQATMQQAERSRCWAYDRSSWMAQQSGSGNNWAQGYMHYGPQLCDAALDLVRRQVEACDLLSGFLLLHSVAGGTGSGFGSAMAQALRDRYPCCSMLSHSVWPHDSGEVIVQSYNVALSLAHMVSAVNGMLLVENDTLSRVCQRLYGLPNPSLQDMNGVAAHALAGILLPSRSRPAAAAPTDAASGSGSRPPPSGERRTVRQLWDVAEAVCPFPTLPLLQLRTLPQLRPDTVDFTTFSWPGTLRRLLQMQITGAAAEHSLDWAVKVGSPEQLRSRPLNRAAATWLVTRGEDAGQVGLEEFADPRLYTSWGGPGLHAACSGVPLKGMQRSATLLANCQGCMPALRSMLHRARSMYQAKVYLHQYSRHGLEPQQLLQSIAACQDVLASYGSLSNP